MFLMFMRSTLHQHAPNVFCFMLKKRLGRPEKFVLMYENGTILQSIDVLLEVICSFLLLSCIQFEQP